MCTKVFSRSLKNFHYRQKLYRSLKREFVLLCSCVQEGEKQWFIRLLLRWTSHLSQQWCLWCTWGKPQLGKPEKQPGPGRSDQCRMIGMIIGIKPPPPPAFTALMNPFTLPNGKAGPVHHSATEWVRWQEGDAGDLFHFLYFLLGCNPVYTA